MWCLANRSDAHKILKEIVEDIVYFALGFIIAYVFYSFLGFLLHTPTPVVSILSGSMIPALYPGDAVVIYGTDDIHVGDIIVFDAKRKGCVVGNTYITEPIIHRVIYINPDGSFETKGDNNLVQIEGGGCEHNITKDYVIGKVVMKIPIIGWPRKLLMDIFGI